MHKDYKEAVAREIGIHYSRLEERVLSDIVRRIRKTGEITSTADWQIQRLKILGNSTEEIEKMIHETLGASYPRMYELYDQVLEKEYVKDRSTYEQINAAYIPLGENKELLQLTEAVKAQTAGELSNLTRSLGFYLPYTGGKKVYTPLAQIYQGYLDDACMDIVSGNFDYNSTLRRVVTQLTNSGLRTVSFPGSNRADRIDVAARRAVMTGISQISGKVAEQNAEKLGTDHFEVDWHEGARPSHSVWQGRVWTKGELHTVCGLGTVEGLLGANCYHSYFPFVPGISERAYTDEWLERQARKENEPKYFRDRAYTTYEARQRQRQMEVAMRAQRRKVRCLEEGKADSDEIMLQKAKYQGQLGEYARFSRKMGLRQERERIYLDGHGRVAPKNGVTQQRYFSRSIEKSLVSGIIKREGKTPKLDLQFFAEKDIKNQESGSLKRAIRKFKKRIKGHEDYLEHPEKHCPDWNEKSKWEQEGLKKHWKKEIRNFNQSIQDRIDELKVRGDYDD